MPTAADPAGFALARGSPLRNAGLNLARLYGCRGGWWITPGTGSTRAGRLSAPGSTGRPLANGHPHLICHLPHRHPGATPARQCGR
jgi:hypothetical protein